MLELVRRLTNRMYHMADEISTRLAALTATVERLDTVEASVLAFIAGVPALVAAAVAQAQAAGATPDQLSAFDALNARLASDADALTAAIVTNTPAEPEGNAAPPVEQPPVEEPPPTAA
jgi:hypothetical protein